MYRSSPHSNNESDHDSDDELPFDMELWSDDEDNSDISRPSNPIPKLLNEESNITSSFHSPESSPEGWLCNNRSQKRLRGDSLDRSSLQLTSSGERWQFQKSFFPLTQKHNSNMFSQSYLVPVTDQSIAYPSNSEPEETILNDLKELELLESRLSPLGIIVNQSEYPSPGDRRSKKSRVSHLPSRGTSNDENIEIISQKRKKWQEQLNENEWDM
mmetsp:Transcript_7507/g.7945  ORF Transcript_7507/g.7945 Transcript_7507/m.7945 type:complete len:214 (+) Transcript_7507:696-1337(+)